jgi:hypothetical protein
METHSGMDIDTSPTAPHNIDKLRANMKMAENDAEPLEE